LAPAGDGEAIILGLALVVRFAPFAGDQALMLQAVERGIERALLDLEAVAGDLLDAQEDAVPVKLRERQSFEDEEIEGALQEVETVKESISAGSLERQGEV
jgi:hypothetical protein